MLISYVTSDKLPNFFVPQVSFLENEEDNALLAVHLLGILAEQMSSCSVCEVLKRKMLVGCKVCLCLTKSAITLLSCAPWKGRGRASALSDKVIPQDSLSSLAPAGLLPVSA